MSLASSTRPDEPTSVLPAPRCALYVVYPPEVAGQTIDLLPGLTIGREPPLLSEGREARRSEASAAFAALPHATVSRRHCLIADAFGAPVLSELGSSNGTKVDGIPLTKPTVVLPRAVVRFGSVLAVVDERPVQDPGWTPALPGIAPSVARAREALGRAATAASPVLIMGETGTGKERVAAELHQRSGRTGTCIKFSCAELSPELAASQLFGHERGAFTGASTSHKGLFAAAHRGTLFLDEVGELHPDLQAKLLRVLQEGEVRPVGSLSTQTVDVRVLAATNRDLAAEVERGTFRRDLYARLSFFEIRLPAVRERRQDIFWWLNCLAANFAAANGVKPVSLQFQPDAAELLLLHAWPENLRGLDRLVHRILALGETTIGRRVLATVAPEIERNASTPAPASDPTRSKEALPAMGADPALAERPSREEFLAVYEGTGRNVRATSKHFGKDRRQIYRWLELFGVER